ncbi:MAG: hypothetical protein GXY82_05050 [Methanospirillum sp.]|nr:hypothetical protein [Methanospirillum sp.]
MVRMPFDVDKIREMQLAVLRRCGDRIERAGYTPSECYRLADQRASMRGFTGGVRARHGL